jgi:hypothetical protein
MQFCKREPTLKIRMFGSVLQNSNMLLRLYRDMLYADESSSQRSIILYLMYF